MKTPPWPALQNGIGATWTVMWTASGAMSLLGAVAVALLVPDQGAPPPAPGSAAKRGRDRRLWRVIAWLVRR